MSLKNYCHSFPPIVDDKSRVLVLGSMPGPEALRKREYYGFNGNHFWTILPALFGEPKPPHYEGKINLVRRHGIALWDVLESCVRPGAADSAIRNIACNPIPDLLRNHPLIRAVFINGQTAHKIFTNHFSGKIDRPVYYLPSSSPANAVLPVAEKVKKWSCILNYLDLSKRSRVTSIAANV